MATEAATTRDRNIAALDKIDEAASAVDAALKAMPNSTASVFDPDDVRRLSETLRQLRILQLARSEVSEQEPSRIEAADSPRWCEICKTFGDHHTDRHAEKVA